MLKSMTLRKKMILGGIIAVIIPLLIAGTIIFATLTDSLIEIYSLKSIQVAEDIATLIDTTLSEELKLVKALSVDNDIIEAVATENYSFADEGLLSMHSEVYSEKDAFFITDQNGIIRADPIHVEQVGIDVSDRKYFETAISGEANISDVLISRGPEESPWAGDIIVVICAPIRIDEGIKGVLSLVLQINYLVEKIVTIKSGKTGYPYILNQDGIVVVHPENEFIFNNNIHDEPGMEDFAELLKTAKTGAGKYNFRGEEKFAGFSVIESTGWTVVFTQNSDEIFEPVNSVLFILLIIAGFFVVITSFFMILFSGTISSPVQKMIDLLKQVTMYSDDIIINIGLDKKIVFANPAVEKIMGIGLNKIIGTKPELKNTQNVKETDIWKLLDDNKSWSGRIKINNADGDSYTIAVLIIPIKDSSGVLQGYLEIGKNITNELLLESRLEQSQKMEALGSITGGIAHDFNNILGCIFGYAEFALSLDDNPDETVECIQEILIAAEGARDLVRQILTFSRHHKFELKPLIAKHIINDAIKLIKTTIPVSIELIINLKSDSVIMAEPTQLNQIIVNLCTNSVYAIKNDKGSIKISLEDVFLDEEYTMLHPEMEPGKYLLLSVSDTGRGIRDDIQERIFEPFFTTKPRGKGTGLGLSVVHGIIKKLNGTITVQSEVGIGTIFKIYFPVVSDKNIEIEKAVSEIKGGDEKIMLVDDEKPIIKIVAKILTNLGYTVTDFVDSKEALKNFEANPDKYDVIITDYLMPELSGLELSKKVKKIRPDIPIILNSGYLSKNVETRASKLGIFKMLAKPVNTYELADAIRVAIGK
jgi:PAS domain S-box-containing protein